MHWAGRLVMKVKRAGFARCPSLIAPLRRTAGKERACPGQPLIGRGAVAVKELPDVADAEEPAPGDVWLECQTRNSEGEGANRDR